MMTELTSSSGLGVSSSYQVMHRHRHIRPLRKCLLGIGKRGPVTVAATLVKPETWAGSSNSSVQSNGVKLTGKDVEDAAMRRCIEQHKRCPNGLSLPAMRWSGPTLENAYERCGQITREYAKTFYMATHLMTPEQAKSTWAIYVWCRRTDELVDGPNASRITPEALDRWEDRLEALFAGHPYDLLDAALTDTISRFPLHIQPFRDMIQGMRMDLTKSRYETFDELYEYCYRVAGTVALMTMPVMGIDPAHSGDMEGVYRAALALGTANQLTNILRDVGEDARERGRVYVPVAELAQWVMRMGFGISETEVLGGKLAVPYPHAGGGRGAGAGGASVVDPRWQAFMKSQISRTRTYFSEAEAGVNMLHPKARWPVWAALILYRQILTVIEANQYDNFSRRAYVPKSRKLMSLPLALVRAVGGPLGLSPLQRATAPTATTTTPKAVR